MLLVWPPDKFLPLHRTHYCCADFKWALPNYFSERFQQDYLLSHWCTVHNSCTGSLLVCGYVLLAMAHLSLSFTPLSSPSWAMSPAPLASGLLSGHPSFSPRPWDGKQIAACKFWLSNRVSYLGQGRHQTTAPGCSWSFPFPGPVQPQPSQWPHTATPPSSQGPATPTLSWVWRVTAQKWRHLEEECQVTALLPSPIGQDLPILGWVRDYPLHWLKTTSQPCRSASNTELTGPCLHTLSCAGGKRSSWKGQSLQHHRPSAKQKFWLCLTNFCNGVKMCSFIC